MTSSTSPTSSGSSALVTSSSSSARGCPASARTIATRCCWPPERSSGRAAPRSARPNRASSACARSRRLGARHAERPHRPEHDVLQHRQMREQVVGLKDHPEPAAHADRRDRRVGDHRAVEEHVAVVDLLQQVDAAQQRRLARAGRADQRHRLMLLDREVDAAQHRHVAVGLGHADDRRARSSRTSDRRPARAGSSRTDRAPPRPPAACTRSSTTPRSAPPGTPPAARGSTPARRPSAAR